MLAVSKPLPGASVNPATEETNVSDLSVTDVDALSFGSG